MTKKSFAYCAVFAFMIASGIGLGILSEATAAQSSRVYPAFEVDPSWPPPLPNNWGLGLVSKISIARDEHVWILHRPRTFGCPEGETRCVPAEGRTAAPPVIELDANGKFVQAWGGPGEGYDWPENEHNIIVDHNDNVWISGTASEGTQEAPRTDDMIIKFTRDGEFLGQIGGRSVSRGNEDTTSVNKPGDLWVFAESNELYVADGYGNRRAIVFDADTLQFKRMWGAFGKPATDEETGSGGIGALGGSRLGRQPGEDTPLDTEGPGSPTFDGPVHGIAVSKDGVVYVCDRPNRRVQVFTTDGTYLTQLFVNRAGPADESAGGIALSADPEQRFLYVSDYGNSHIVVVDRERLEIMYQFGRNGEEPGNFAGVHHIAVDSEGNLYTAEVYPGARAQKFNFQGLSSTVPANATGSGSEVISAPYREP